MTKNNIAVVLVTVVALMLMARSSVAQDAVQASLAFAPGDTVRVLVTFKEQVSLTAANARWNLQGSPIEGQKVFRSFFDSAAFTKLSDSEYELTFKVSEDVATGTYKLDWINGTIGPDLTRGFSAGTDYPALSLRVHNAKRVDFPNIKDVKLESTK